MNSFFQTIMNPKTIVHRASCTVHRLSALCIVNRASLILLVMLMSANMWGEDYDLYTSSTITEGDYIIVGYQTSSQNYYAMNNTCTSNQYMGITSVSPSNNTITSTSSAIVWTISASTNGYYIKNSNNFLNDNATSSKNYAQLVSSATTTCEWNFAYNSTEKTWTITNYGTTTTKKTLSFNIGSTRVACYASIQSGNTCCYLYKKQSASVPTTITYHVGSTNGTVNSNVGTSLTTAMASVATTSCDDNSTTFMGWSTAPIDGKVQTAPSSLLASTATVTANMEVWAVWAKKTDKSSTLTLDASNLSSVMGSSYVSTDFSYSGLSFGRSNAAIMSSTIQIKGGTSNCVYNKTALSGAITKIVVTGKTNSSTLTVGTSQSPTTNSVSCSTSTTTKEYDASNNYTYFKIAATSSYTQVASIVITYSSTTYSDYLTSCSPTTYTVNFVASPAGYGSVSKTSLENVASGTSISANGATLTVGSTNITATPTTATAQYTYTFSNWTWNPTGSTITAATTATANFTRTENCTNEITITKGTPSNGSFTLSQTGVVCIDDGNATVSVTNISPATHYHFKQITATNGSVDNPNKQVTNISANTTINVEFEEDTKYTITFVDAVHGESVDPKSVYENETFTFPSITDKTAVAPTGDCVADHYHFVGWVEEGTTPTQSPSNVITAGTTSIKITKNVTYKAVWAKEEL